MERSKKTLRLRGSRTGGKGRNFKNGAGARGGTGKAGSLTHKYLHFLLKKRKDFKNRKAINLNVLQSKLDYLINKAYLIYKGTDDTGIKNYAVTSLFSKKYKKILSTGETSVRILPTKLVKFSKRTSKKML